MRNALIILLWAWIPFCGNPLWGQAPRPRESKASHEPKQKRAPENSKTNVDAAAVPPVVVESPDEAKRKQEADKAKREEDYKKLVDAWTLCIAGAVALFTLALVVVGAIGVCAAIRTLRAIEKQSKHMANSERPWILINKLGEAPLLDFVERPEEFEFLSGKPMAVAYYKIYGNTPARIVSIHTRFHFINKKIGRA